MASAENNVIQEKTFAKDGTEFTRAYQRGRLLGRGGFADCYELTELSTGQRSAVKVVSKLSLKQSSARDKLMTEISIHRRLRHRHIVRFERYFEDLENVYIVLELLSLIHI